MSNHEIRDPEEVPLDHYNDLMYFGYYMSARILAVGELLLNRYVTVDVTNSGRPHPARVVMVEEDRYTFALISITTGQLTDRTVRASRHAIESGAVQVFRMARLVNANTLAEAVTDVGSVPQAGNCYRDTHFELELCDWSRLEDPDKCWATKGDLWSPHEFLFNHPPSRADFKWLVSNLPWLATATVDIMPIIDRSPWPLLLPGSKVAMVEFFDLSKRKVGHIRVCNQMVFGNQPCRLYQDPVVYLNEVLARYRGRTKGRADEYLRKAQTQAMWRELVAASPYLDRATVKDVSVYAAGCLLFDVCIRKTRPSSPPLIYGVHGYERGEEIITQVQPDRRIVIDD